MQRLCSRTHVAGFTVTELLVTMIIAGVVLGLGLPSFRSLMADNH